MNTEFEAKFLNIDKEAVRTKLKGAGATLVRPEFFQKRVNFELPKERRSNDTWLRVRDEGDKITLALKTIEGSSITDQKEIQLTISDFNSAISLLELIGCEKKAPQESKRELWKIGDTEITIDTWPALETFVEIESKSEDEVKRIANLLGFDYTKAIFSAVGRLYKMKYGKALDDIEKEYGEISFNNERLKNING